jgi:hypothetical protein
MDPSSLPIRRRLAHCRSLIRRRSRPHREGVKPRGAQHGATVSSGAASIGDRGPSASLVSEPVRRGLRYPLLARFMAFAGIAPARRPRCRSHVRRSVSPGEVFTRRARCSLAAGHGRHRSPRGRRPPVREGPPSTRRSGADAVGAVSPTPMASRHPSKNSRTRWYNSGQSSLCGGSAAIISTIFRVRIKGVD